MWIGAGLLLVFVGGVACGGLVARQRYKSAQIVAAVNGTTITQDQFYARLRNAAGNQVIRQLVAEELQRQYAKREGLLPSEKAIDAKLEELRRDPSFEKTLASRGETVDDVRERLSIGMAGAAIMGKGVQVSEADTRSYYRANCDKSNPRARFYHPETAQVAVITTPNEEAARAARRALTLGTTFATVANDYSSDPSRVNGGILPPVQRGRTLLSRVPELEKTVFGLKIGQVVGPVQMAGRWWILRCLDRKTEVTDSFDKVREVCRDAVMLQKGIPKNSKRVQGDFEDFRQKSAIQAFWKQYKEVIGAR